MRFGRALRLLGEVNHAKLVDLLDDLERAQTQKELISTLTKTAQACKVASAKTSFVIVPDEKDFGYVLEDVDLHGVGLIASMLQILSALRYPSSDREPGTGDKRLPDEAPGASPSFTAAPAEFTTEGEIPHGE